MPRAPLAGAVAAAIGQTDSFPRTEDRIKLEGNAPVVDKGAVHALQHLEHFLSWFFGSKEFWAAIVGAVVGGLMTGVSALYAQKQAAKDQCNRDLQAERRTTDATLQAIAAEMEAFKLEFDLSKPVDWKQNYFAVFDQNAGVIGQIANGNLRRNIIRTYSKAKGLMDYYNYVRSPQLGESDRQEVSKRLLTLHFTINATLEEIKKYLET